MTDVFSQLQHGSWRGITLPIVSRRRTFSHQEVTHQIQYASGEIVELTVRNNWRFDYTLRFGEDIIKGPYGGELFSKTLDQFVKAFEDREPGLLVDPIHGSLNARPISFIEQTDTNRRDGVDVDVSFVENKTTDQLESQADRGPSIGAIISDAKTIDSIMAAQDWGGSPPEQISAEEQEWTQETPPDPTVNPIDAVAGVFRQTERVTQRTKAVYQDTSRRLDNLESAIASSVNAVGLWNLHVNARELRLNVLRTEARERALRRPLRVSVLPQDMNVFSVAKMVGLSLGELLQLNPAFRNESIIDQGTRVTHYR